MRTPVPEFINDLNRCPYCGSKEINFEDITGEDNLLIQEVTCDECDASWNEVFEFKCRDFIPEQEAGTKESSYFGDNHLSARSAE